MDASLKIETNEGSDDQKDKVIINTSVSTDDFKDFSYKKIREITDSAIEKFNNLKTNQEEFKQLMSDISLLYQMVKEYSGKETQLENIFRFCKAAANQELLLFSSYKTIKYAIAELGDPDLTHLFIVRLNVKLIGNGYNNILIDYITSISDVDFINSDNEEINIYITMFELLINYGCCNINSVDQMSGNSALHLSVKYKQYHLLFLYFKYKALTFYTNNYGFTALDYAIYLAYDESANSTSEDKVIYEEIAKLLRGFNAESSFYIKDNKIN